MKCFECGKTLAKDEICVPLMVKGKPFMFYHTTKELNDQFIKTCKTKGLDPNHVLMAMIVQFSSGNEKK